MRSRTAAAPAPSPSPLNMSGPRHAASGPRHTAHVAHAASEIAGPPNARVGHELISAARWRLGEYSTKGAWEPTSDVSIKICGPNSQNTWLTSIYVKMHPTFPATTGPVISVWDTNLVEESTETLNSASNGRLIISSETSAGRLFFFEPPVMMTEEEDLPVGDGRIVRRIYQLRFNLRAGLRISLTDPTAASMANLMHITARWWYC